MRYLILLLILWGCNEQSKSAKNSTAPIVAKTKAIRHGSPEIELVVLGTVQDAGAPQIACQKECCKNRFDAPDPSLQVVSLGLIDHTNQERYVFEATPDFPKQIKAAASYGRFWYGVQARWYLSNPYPYRALYGSYVFGERP